MNAGSLRFKIGYHRGRQIYPVLRNFLQAFVNDLGTIHAVIRAKVKAFIEGNFFSIIFFIKLMHGVHLRRF